MRNVFRVVLAALLIGGAVQAQQAWPDLSGQSVRVAGVWSGDEQANFTAVLNEFATLTGATVEFFSTGNDIATVVGTQLEGGSPPDIALLPQPGLLVEFANRGALVNIEDSVGDLVDEYYAQAWRDLGSVNGDLYGVWFKAANKSLLWYNADILAAAGVEAPTTWDEFVVAAQTVYDSGVTPISVAGGDGWTLTDWFENVYLRSAGADMYDQLTNHQISWTDDSVKEALGYLAQIWQHDWLANGLQGTLEAGFPVGTVQPFLDNPTAAFAYGADFSAGVIAADTNAE
ncbi:MAG: ABC transporter substrate-binding protein, partial [Trueperaceae bacterium]